MINVPTLNQRREILKQQCSRLRVDSRLDLDAVSRMTNGYVGADLMLLSHEAAFSALGSLKAETKYNKVVFTSIDPFIVYRPSACFKTALFCKI